MSKVQTQHRSDFSFFNYFFIYNVIHENAHFSLDDSKRFAVVFPHLRGDMTRQCTGPEVIKLFHAQLN